MGLRWMRRLALDCCFVRVCTPSHARNLLLLQEKGMQMQPRRNA